LRSVLSYGRSEIATIDQIRGMLLEEAVLQLLRTAGYTTVENAGNDPTLHDGHSGLEVHGRGGRHQLDAIADPSVSLPFSSPQRLVVEAKCYSTTTPVGLPIIRNAVGVLKDISEFYVPPADPADLVYTRRYHYQYSMFSASGYTRDAERYAFAQDIFLIQYSRSSFIFPIVGAIRQVTQFDFGTVTRNRIKIDMTQFRRYIRETIRHGEHWHFDQIPNGANEKIAAFVQAVIRIPGTLLAIAGHRFPIHLIPAPAIDLYDLKDYYRVRITWDERSWYLSDEHGYRLFSFDLPPVLFNLYAEHGILTRSKALDLKAEALNMMQALLVTENMTRLITFELDKNWVYQVREHLV